MCLYQIKQKEQIRILMNSSALSVFSNYKINYNYYLLLL
nr:MAG TPA: hypothetical protein [Caudoviricetes sp.]DAV74868.1 MAG TPA: hypothetical protein [Caudoviricetes sp.]